MKNWTKIVVIIVGMAVTGFAVGPNTEKMDKEDFIEIVVQNHMILHGFDDNNKEIIEEVVVDRPMRKLIRVDRIQSISEKYILTTYGFGRLVYWEYEGSYEELKVKLKGG